MRRVLSLISVVVSLIFVGAGVANAQSETVTGTGDITKIIVGNGTSSLTAKVFGLGVECGGAQYLHVEVLNRIGRLLYTADGSCIQAVWHVGLYYTATGIPEDNTAVKCPAFTFTRSQKTGAYRTEMPRSCLVNAPNRVKVRAEGANYGSMTGGTAGPTQLLARG